MRPPLVGSSPSKSALPESALPESARPESARTGSARPTRRELLHAGAAAALGIPVLGVPALGLPVRARRQDGAQDGGSEQEDYRALVCVHLNGGVDGFGYALPLEADLHAPYAAARQDLTVARDTLVPLRPRADYGGPAIGMMPELAPLAERFHRGDLALVANVGPLVAPLSKSEYLAGSVPVPGFLFSHSDQTEQWLVACADRLGAFGWCGQIADRLARANGGSALPMCLSTAGATKMLVGRETAPYFLSTKGSEPIEALSQPRLRAAFERLLRSRDAHPMERRYGRVAREAIEIDALLADAYEDAPDFEGLFAPDNPLAWQLRTVARVVSVRARLGMRRQVFFVEHEGYDTHAGQDVYLGPLLTELAHALDAFQTALERIGATEVVTTFTTSEFGRTLSSNGKGTDHGWGNHHLVLGGAVHGRRVHGALPELVLGGPDDIDEGRILPTASVDQYAATLARWLGVPADDLPKVFPNLGRFPSADLGFLRGPA